MGSQPGSPSQMLKGRIRRSHNKSRNGCRECKQRHIKCDERRPACINCLVARNRCSFLGLVPHAPAVRRLFASVTASPAAATSTSTTVAVREKPVVVATPPASTCGTVTEPCSPAPSSPTVSIYSDATSDAMVPLPMPGDPAFNVQYMELFRHLQTDWTHSMGLARSTATALLNLTTECAGRAPYLTYQLLSVAAAHLSTVHADRRAFYEQMLSQLQTRALAQFNMKQRNVESDTYMAMFMFSGLLNLTTMFDILRTRDSFPLFLERFNSFVTVSRGMRSITADGWWHRIEPLLKDRFHIDMNGVFTVLAIDGSAGRVYPQPISECANLLRLLGDGDDTDATEVTDGDRESAATAASVLLPAMRQTCAHAARVTQNLLHAQSMYPAGYHQTLDVIMAWPNCIQADFVELLRRRQPEALVVLAHFALMVHRARDHWVVGNSAQSLVADIARYLGSYWTEWLAYPLSELGIEPDSG